MDGVENPVERRAPKDLSTTASLATNQDRLGDSSRRATRLPLAAADVRQGSLLQQQTCDKAPSCSSRRVTRLLVTCDKAPSCFVASKQEEAWSQEYSQEGGAPMRGEVTREMTVVYERR